MKKIITILDDDPIVLNLSEKQKSRIKNCKFLIKCRDRIEGRKNTLTYDPKGIKI